MTSGVESRTLRVSTRHETLQWLRQAVAAALARVVPNAGAVWPLAVAASARQLRAEQLRAVFRSAR